MGGKACESTADPSIDPAINRLAAYLVRERGHDLAAQQRLVGPVARGEEGRVGRHEDARARAVDLVEGDAGVLEALEGRLEHAELLEVHVARDLALDVEQVRVVRTQLWKGRGWVKGGM